MAGQTKPSQFTQVWRKQGATGLGGCRGMRNIIPRHTAKPGDKRG